MKRILLHTGKNDKIGWDASTTELAEQAILSLFKYLDEQYHVYEGMYQMESRLYNKAKEGDANAAKKILSMRKKYEYEWWEFINLQEGEVK